MDSRASPGPLFQQKLLNAFLLHWAVHTVVPFGMHDKAYGRAAVDVFGSGSQHENRSNGCRKCQATLSPYKAMVERMGVDRWGLTSSVGLTCVPNCRGPKRAPNRITLNVAGHTLKFLSCRHCVADAAACYCRSQYPVLCASTTELASS